MFRAFATFAFTTIFLSSTLASAAEDTGPSETRAPVAPARAFELTIGQGYNQGFGDTGNGSVALQDLSRGGPSLQLGFGYRLNPRLFLGVYAEGARYFETSEVGDDTEVYGTAFGAQMNWHFMPFSKIDPWIGVGTGLRAHWVDRERASTEAYFGVDIVRLRVGADYQLGPSTRVGPMIGATLATFDAHRSATNGDIAEIEDPVISTFVFAGFQGRFEIGGQRVTEKQLRTARR